MALQFLTFWAVNGALDPARLKQQLQDMKRLGFDGAIFHPRYYPGQPPYMGKDYLRHPLRPGAGALLLAVR